MGVYSEINLNAEFYHNSTVKEEMDWEEFNENVYEADPPDEVFSCPDYHWINLQMSTLPLATPPLATSPLATSLNNKCVPDMSEHLQRVTHSSTESTGVIFNPDMFLNPIYKMDKEEENSYMETNVFSPDSGYGASPRPGTPSDDPIAGATNDSIVAEATNLTLKRSRESSSCNDESSITKRRVTSCIDAELPVQVITCSGDKISGVTGSMLMLSEERKNSEYNHVAVHIAPQIPSHNFSEYSGSTAAGVPNRAKTTAGSTNCTSFKCVTLTEDDFEEKLCDFRAGSHCSLDVSVVILTKAKVRKSLKDMKLTEVTLEFLNTHFKNDCKIILKKKDLNNNTVEQFKMGSVTGKRSVVFCRDTLKGVALHLIDIELQNEGGDRKRANNKFSHYQRSSRSAGDKLTNHYAGKYGIDVEDYNHADLEDKMKVSLMIFDKMGYLTYCSKELKQINCVLYSNDKGMFLVKARFVRAFGSFYINKKV